MTLYPDTDQPFENEMDVVRRLLPYHIYQYPQHDLDEMRGIKGKARATETDLLREEVKGKHWCCMMLLCDTHHCL